jgi:leader peptidase (prepilin peptidase)/N-methyltransferase
MFLNPGIFSSTVGTWHNYLGVGFLPAAAFLFLLLAAILLIDLENQLIPDGLTFILMISVTTALFLFSKNPYFYLASGLTASLFLLSLALVTKGRGMGMGDVKLALVLGAILGWPQTPIWLFLSFLIGGVFAILLLVGGKTSFGKKIAFGPFLIVGFVASLFWGDKLWQLLKL